MKAFAKVSVEACVLFLRGSFHSFHEFSRKEQVVQETARVLPKILLPVRCSDLVRVDQTW